MRRKRLYICILIVVIILLGLDIWYFTVYNKSFDKHSHDISRQDSNDAGEKSSSQDNNTKKQTEDNKKEKKTEEGDKPDATSEAEYVYSQPSDGFKARVTKKQFGTYVEPGNSPVSPEKFTGYHTGADAEYGDVSGDVEVRAIADGIVIASQYVSGYGGAVAVRSVIDGAERVVIYGHLDPNRLPPVGEKLSRGEQFAYLGKGYSNQTSGERKHLHLGILKGNSLNWKGYVQSKSQLSEWLNPIDILDQKE